MNKNLPSVFKGKNIKNQHCKDIYYIDNKLNSNERYVDNISVSEKLKKLFKTNRYVFNIGVIIETNEKVYDTKIAGKIKNSIVTVEGDTIPIIEIKNLIIKDRV